MALSKTKEKGDLKETIEKVKNLVVDCTDYHFHVKVESDDYGNHICYYVERDLDDKQTLKERLPSKVNGWRIVYVTCPNGYIKAFWG
jgi:hypothetical protein